MLNFDTLGPDQEQELDDAYLDELEQKVTYVKLNKVQKPRNIWGL